MKVLVACETSGAVRNRFRELGHNAFSCDLLPSEDNSPFHLQVDLFGGHFNFRNFDLLIAHPPCTDLAVSGARWFPAKRADGRQQKSIEFFMRIVNLPVPRIAIENPIGIMSRLYRKPDQIIQPWQFGHPESKATCLWLKNLPPLEPTRLMVKPDCGYWENQTPSGQNKLGPSPDRWKIRSKTYDGIASAMANQWGALDGQMLLQGIA